MPQIEKVSDMQALLLQQLNELREKQLSISDNDTDNYVLLAHAICTTIDALMCHFGFNKRLLF